MTDFKVVVVLVCLMKATLMSALGVSGVGEVARDQRVEARLVAERGVVTPGSTVWAGLVLVHDEHWHTYWKNPGDSGLPTTLEWKLPPRVTAGEIRWPAPEPLPFADLVNYGYEDTVILLVPLSLDADLEPGTLLELEARADWLMCDDVCIPGGADLRVKLAVGASADAEASETEFAGAIRSTYEALPQKVEGLRAEAYQRGDRLFLDVHFPEGSDWIVPERLFFFAEEELIDPSARQNTAEFDGGVRIEMTRSTYAPASVDRFFGVLVALDGGSFQADEALPIALVVDAPVSGDALPELAGLILDARETVALASRGGLLLILFAFVGGLILNLMPCVFPVLGLKIMGFVSQAGEDRRRIAIHGLVFTAGVLVSFWILAGLLIGLRGAGEELGWGFQLQSPGFVFILAVVLLIFGLNLSGVFEIGTSAVGVGSGLTRKKGYGGSFYSGILATVVATPCAAPILAPALGGALALPPMSSLIVFTFIGLGLAAPYLILSAFPNLTKLLPRPGAWMETFKQSMAFLLYGTVAYLVWVLVGQLSANDQMVALFSLVAIGLACWIYGRYATFGAATRGLWTARVATAVILIGAVWAGLSTESDEIAWETWSPERVEALREEGRPVYVDFTARWCATCQVNKRVVFSSDAVNRYFNDNNVAALIADWTNQDPAITRALAEFDRTAIPFNLVYLPGEDEPIILPELLTPGIVLNALRGRDVASR